MAWLSILKSSCGNILSIEPKKVLIEKVNIIRIQMNSNSNIILLLLYNSINISIIQIDTYI